jgi:DNA-binding transcriptional MerR regulator
MVAGPPVLNGGKNLKANEELDYEWVQLIKEALELGIDKEEIRKFLKEKNLVGYIK